MLVFFPSKLFTLFRVIPYVLLAVFRNVNLSNLEKVLQRNLRTGRAEDCIFRASRGTSFENFSA